MDTVDESIFENGTGLRVAAQPAAAASQAVADAFPSPSAPLVLDEWGEQRLFRVVLNLSGGEWVEVGSFDDEASADAHAREIAGRLASTDEWPRVRGRYLRPDTIMSIEISERRRMTG